jgi:hypothetical protein
MDFFLHAGQAASRDTTLGEQPTRDERGLTGEHVGGVGAQALLVVAVAAPAPGGRQWVVSWPHLFKPTAPASPWCRVQGPRVTVDGEDRAEERASRGRCRSTGGRSDARGEDGRKWGRVVAEARAVERRRARRLGAEASTAQRSGGKGGGAEASAAARSGGKRGG